MVCDLGFRILTVVIALAGHAICECYPGRPRTGTVYAEHAAIEPGEQHF